MIKKKTITGSLMLVMAFGVLMSFFSTMYAMENDASNSSSNFSSSSSSSSSSSCDSKRMQLSKKKRSRSLSDLPEIKWPEMTDVSLSDLSLEDDLTNDEKMMQFLPDDVKRLERIVALMNQDIKNVFTQHQDHTVSISVEEYQNMLKSLITTLYSQKLYDIEFRTGVKSLIEKIVTFYQLNLQEFLLQRIKTTKFPEDFDLASALIFELIWKQFVDMMAQDKTTDVEVLKARLKKNVNLICTMMEMLTFLKDAFSRKADTHFFIESFIEHVFPGEQYAFDAFANLFRKRVDEVMEQFNAILDEFLSLL